MVRTVAKSGPRIGQPLWRCSDFDCRTMINIDESVEAPRAPAAGESAQAQFERERHARTERLFRVAPFLAAAGVLSAAIGFFAAATFVEVRIAAVVGLSITLLFAWFAIRLPPEVIFWGRGAEAERRVGASLDALESLGFVTLYDRRIRGRGGNIDSITVGPPGVFVVETKYRGRGVEIVNGRLEVGGREQSDTIRQVTENAMLVQVSVAQAMNRHRLTVVPVICIANRKIEGGERAGGVLVLDAKSIGKRLLTEPPVLQASEVQELATLLDNALPPYERRA